MAPGLLEARALCCVGARKSLQMAEKHLTRVRFPPPPLKRFEALRGPETLCIPARGGGTSRHSCDGVMSSCRLPRADEPPCAVAEREFSKTWTGQISTLSYGWRRQSTGSPLRRCRDRGVGGEASDPDRRTQICKSSGVLQDP